MAKTKTKNQKIITASVLFLTVTSLFLQLFSYQIASAGLLQEIATPIGDGADAVSEFLGLDELGSGDTAKTSFTEFKGGLETPSTEGYAAGLTKATDARQFALNVTNFVLGFLGLTAVLVIIYGGFLYLTAAGEEDKTTKGKKSIQYALMGILIILGSYAIVNTILQAPSGTDSNIRGSADEESTQVVGGSVKRQFNVLASRVQTTARNIVTAFAFHFDAKKDLVAVEALMHKAYEQMDPCKSMDCGDDWTDSDIPLKAVFDRFKQSSDNAVSILKNIKNYVPSGTIDKIVIEGTIDDMIAYLNSSWDSALNKAYDLAISSGCTKDQSSDACNPGEPSKVVAEFLKNYPTEATLFSDKSPYGKAKEAVLSNFDSTINESKNQLKQAYDQIAPITDVADDAFDALVTLSFLKQDTTLITKDSLANATGSLNSLKSLVESFTEATPSKNDPPFVTLYDVLKQFTTLYNILKDILFVDARITATVAQGNAPLVINFSAVGSLDPSGITIQDQQIEWDLDGNGKYNAQVASNGFMNCKEEAKITVTCIYTQPGTYRVKAKIKPSAETNPVTGKTYDQEIGTGLAIIDIQVNPPETKMNIAIENVQDKPIDIIKYNEEGFLILDRSSITVPLSKAQQGLQFNASPTQTKEGPLSSQAGEGATVLWNFGDGVNDGVNNTLMAATQANLNQTHKYTKEGSYNVSVEVTDKNKVVDRKVFSLVVSTLSPAINLSKKTFRVNEEAFFDGSNSISDNGPITSYDWSFMPVDFVSDKKLLQQESFKTKFITPGQYKVTLKVADDIKEATISEEFSIESEAPIAQINYKIPDPTQPALVVLDGTNSYDPDGKAALDYEWEVNGQSLKKLNSTIAEVVDNNNPAQPRLKFKEKGTYNITLVAIDPNGLGVGNAQESIPVEKEITIDNILDIAWGTKDSQTGALKTNAAGEQEASITFNLISDTAVAYEIDFGDDEKENGELTGSVTIDHKYKEGGTFVAKASVFDKEDNENTIARKIFITSSKNPVAVVGLKVNDEEIIDTTKPIHINRKDALTFDAKNSRNTDGTGRRLTYSWDFGDGEKSAKEQATHTYSELGDYKVTLKVTNSADVSQIATDTVLVEVVGKPPVIRGLTAVPVSATLTTPVTVNLSAIGTEDKDGKIVSYRWWYYDPENDTEERGTQITTAPNATVVIGTLGEEGESKVYNFAVEIKDNENNIANSNLVLDEKLIPSLTVTNGPNKSPVAKFNVDHTSIFVGEAINFTSSSIDPDGTITAYYWDWENDGFANNTKNEGPNVSHVFTQAAPDGLDIRLKVVDNNESQAVSAQAITVFIDDPNASIAEKPQAAFTSSVQGKSVKFTNTSTVDTAKGVSIKKYTWDFDMNIDSNGDGKKDNDVEAVEANPTYLYPDYAIYRAKLTIEDSEGMTSQITNFVNVKATAAPAPAPAAPAPTPAPHAAAPALDARLLTTPATNVKDGKVHLKGDTGSVTFDFSSSIGSITSYELDKNIYFDSNGNGVKDDDADYQTTTAGKWTTEFSRSFGLIKVRLTVKDTSGKKDSVEKEIVFDSSADANFLASVLDTDSPPSQALLVSFIGFVILTLTFLGFQNLKNKQKTNDE